MRNVSIIVLSLIAGFVLSFLLLDGREETLKTRLKEKEHTITELQSQINIKEKLISNLKQNQKIVIIKNVDGSSQTTIETSTESNNTASTNTTVSSNQTIEQDKESEKAEEKKKIKKVVLDVGLLSNQSYYVHASFATFGIFVLGTHLQTNFSSNTNVGVGVGISF